jgi:integrase
MTSRRKRPDGLPFNLFQRTGKFKVSFGYKSPSNNLWLFRLSAPINKPDLVAEARKDAIQRAEELNGHAPKIGTVSDMVSRYFKWQTGMNQADLRKKAKSTLIENQRESKNIEKVFGRMVASEIKPKHIYKYLSLRADGGAAAKANKEISLLSAILEYGRAQGELDVNPCRDIRYNPTRPSAKFVESKDLEFALTEARCRGGSYHIMALCFLVAYLTASRPEEVRSLTRQSIKNEGLEIVIGKRRATQHSKSKLIKWSPRLKATVDEALSLQRTSSILLFGNTAGQQYSRSGWTTIWTRLMRYCETKAKNENVSFERFSLSHMRPKAVTTRKERGDVNIKDATGHGSERMIDKTYDRRAIRKSEATE